MSGHTDGGDPSPTTLGNRRPANIAVVSNLASDTIIAGAMDIKSGRNSVAMFSNPFRDGVEEMLYVDEQDVLRWARHSSLATGLDRSAGSGWTIDEIAGGVAEVVVAVHPMGTVWALAASAGRTAVRLFQLVGEAGASDPRWVSRRILNGPDAEGPAGTLWLHYLNDRPATATVFFVVADIARVWPIIADVPPRQGDTGVRWSCQQHRTLPPQEAGRIRAIAFDGPARDTFRAYSIDTPGIVRRTTFSSGGNPVVENVDVKWDYIAGSWATTNGAGCVGVRTIGGVTTLAYCYPREAGQSGSWTDSINLDRVLDDVVVWQDAEARLHVYGRAADGSVNVLHQVDWQFNTITRAKEPVWDQHRANQVTQVGTTRPLFANVARFALDAFPDDMPNQHVMHSGVEPGEMCALYTQQVGTSFWAREKVRLVPAALPKPYVVPRYESTLTVTNAYGGPIAHCELLLTADEAVDLEVAGRFYRTSPNVPVRLVTDGGGRITLRVVARSLVVPALHVTAPGLTQAVTVQQAAPVHSFLGGTGTLPNHTSGFTPAVVASARKPGGGELFPKLNRTQSDASWPPRAEDVVDWCRAAFSVGSGAPLPASFTASAAGEPIRAFSLQTWDPARPGLAVYTSAVELEAHRQQLDAAGLFDGFTGWFGDIIQGIREGVVEVGEVLIDVVNSTIEILIELPDGVRVWLNGVWDDITSASHAIEAAFSALGAAVMDVVDFLTWGFDFTEAFRVADVLLSGVTLLPVIAKPPLDEFSRLADNWFTDREEDVRKIFEQLKSATAGRNVASITTAPGAAPDPSGRDVSLTKEQIGYPHTNWLMDQLANPAMASATVQVSQTANDLIDRLLNICLESPAWAEFDAALNDAGDLVTNLFTPQDPEMGLSLEFETLFDCFEHIIEGLLKLLDSVVKALIVLAKEMIDLVVELFEAPIDDDGLLSTIWDFMVSEAGVDPAKYPLTVGRLSMVMYAIPLTALFTSVMGRPAFQDGVFPWPPSPVDGGDPCNATDSRGGPNDALLFYQWSQGFVQGLDSILDGWIDVGALQPPPIPPMVPPRWLVMCYAFAHVIWYAIGDAPYFWGYPLTGWPSLSPWGRYTITAILNVADAVCAYAHGTVVEALEGPEAAFVNFLFGSTRIGFQIFEFERGPKNWVATWNLWINLTAYLQTPTAFIRAVYREWPSEPTWTALMAKAVADSAMDLYSGISTGNQVIDAWIHPPYLVASMPLPEGTVGKAYDSGLISTINGLPPYSYSIRADTPLPPGLKLQVNDQWDPLGYNADEGSTAQIVGTPTLPGIYDFVVHMEDSYGPSFTDDAALKITIIGYEQR